MAFQASSRPLDPFATPYNKIHPSNFYVYHPPHPLPRYPVFRPMIPIPPSFPSFNLHFQPPPQRLKPPPISHPPPPPPPPISPEKKIDSSFLPVASGPRIPKSRFHGHPRRKINNPRKEWRPRGNDHKKEKDEKKGNDQRKQKKVVVSEVKRRWKNGNGDYQQILPLEINTTSVMIKNIPNKYTRKLLIQTLDNHCKLMNEKLKNDSVDHVVSAYDFLYLPIDFIQRVNAGFAFVNFTTPEAASRFKEAFHGKQWELFGSPKLAEITRARIQGKNCLVNNCKAMDFTYGFEGDMPVSFDPARDGSDHVGSKMTILGKFRP